MEKLLKWSLDAQHNPNAPPPDPQLLAQALFGGPDERTDMTESLRTAVESEDMTQRLEALENFEDHVAHIDNANNMGKLWEPLLYLVGDPEPEIRAAALSTVGTAAQNNEQAQKVLVEAKHAIPLLLEHINDPAPTVAHKALYALSAALAHCPAAYEQFEHANGWSVFSEVFDQHFDSDLNPAKLRSRVLSLLHALVLNAPHKPVFAKIDSMGLIQKLRTLRETQDDAICEKIDDIFNLLRELKYIK